MSNFVLVLLLACDVTWSRRINEHSSELWSNELTHNRERIYRGQPANEILPYHVALQALYHSAWIEYCGGAIISASHILTAAHCADDYDRSNMGVLAGTVNKHTGSRHNVSHIYMHPRFSEAFPFPNDIAVLQVVPPFDFAKTPTIRPIGMSARVIQPNERVRVAGWGKWSDAGVADDYPDHLQVLDQSTMPNPKCESQWVKHYKLKNKTVGTVISDKQLCTFRTTGTCEGDSGGPLVTVDSKTPQLIGVVSFGTKSCGSDMPDVYTRVSSYMPFILDAINGKIRENKFSKPALKLSNFWKFWKN